MDIANILTRKGYEGWEVVERDGKEPEITRWPKGVKQPTKAELQTWWDDEIAVDLERERIAREREQRYKQETDGLLYDALAKLELPQLDEWKAAREAIKTELAYPEEESVDVIKR